MQKIYFKGFYNMARRKTHSEFVIDILSKFGDTYKVKDKYKNSRTPVLVHHAICNSDFNILPKEDIKRKNLCPICFPKKVNNGYNLIDFKKALIEKGITDYELVSDFINTNTYVKMKHLVCGNVVDVIPDNILHGKYSCPICLANRYSRDYRRDTLSYRNQIETETAGEYTPISEYKDVYTYIKMRHNVCGNEWDITPQIFQHGRRCPRCSGISYGERDIIRALEELDVLFEYQKSFADLRDINPLTYDFYLPNYNTLIEYQGIQHYKPRELFGGDEAFNKQNIHDSKKRNYASIHGYTLLEIPYTVTGYENILSNIKIALS